MLPLEVHPVVRILVLSKLFRGLPATLAFVPLQRLTLLLTGTPVMMLNYP